MLLLYRKNKETKKGVVDSLKKNKIFVMGSYVTDLTARASHLPKPGETVFGQSFRTGAGGKGSNQAVAAARLGAEVTLVTKLGDDAFGKLALEHFTKEQIDTSQIAIDKEMPTGSALIAVDDQSENMIVVTAGACGKIKREEIEQAEEKLADVAIALTQLETNLDAVERTLELAEKHRIPVILNPAPYQAIPNEWLKKAAYITPNETEAAQLTGIRVETEEDARLAAEKLYQMGVANVVITLGKKGCFLYNEEYKGKVFPGLIMDAVDTTGAGDAFNGGLAYALANEVELIEALQFANIVGALAVTKEGTAQAMPTLAEVETCLKQSLLEVKS